MRLTDLRLAWAAGLALALAPSAPARAGSGTGEHVHSACGPDCPIHTSHPFPGVVVPYRSQSGLYGYPDMAYGRGPVNDLGRATLYPGFQGYGPFGSPGYGLGMGPTSHIDSAGRPRPKFWPFSRYRFRYGSGYEYGQ